MDCLLIVTGCINRARKVDVTASMLKDHSYARI